MGSEEQYIVTSEKETFGQERLSVTRDHLAEC